jgi:hypothetical protein
VALSGLVHRGKPRPSDRAGHVDLTGDDHDVCALVDREPGARKLTEAPGPVDHVGQHDFA